MKRPFTVWIWFGLCLFVAVPAMTWLTWQTLALDRARETDRQQTELARREAELQERITSAMWRMDWLLTPLVAQEAARPHFVYRPFYKLRIPTPEKQGKLASPGFTLVQQPSPLLLPSSEFVLLHFQISPENIISSPQYPEQVDMEWVLQCGILPDAIERGRTRLDEVCSFCEYEPIFERCPSLKLPSVRKDLTFPDQVASTAQSDFPSSILPSAIDLAQTDSSPTFNEQVTSQRPVPQLPVQQQTNFLDNTLNENLSQQMQQYLQEETQTAGDLALSEKIQKSQVQQQRNSGRGNREYFQRRNAADTYAEKQWLANNGFQNFNAFDEATVVSDRVREGQMRPLWIRDRLVLVRRVEIANQEVIQGCWLDWPVIQQALQDEVQDLLPDVELRPVREDDDVLLSRTLATLPVEVDVDASKLLASLQLPSTKIAWLSGPSGLKLAIWMAWGGLGLAAIAGGVLLLGVVKLSERRGTFVSAVTHELRTPLTTFRMYAEMLAEDMVPEEKKKEYVQTLHQESERLTHLVENVLQFARLEQSHTGLRRERLTLAALLGRFQQRLEQRAQQANMEYVVGVPPAMLKMELDTDPATVEQILFNLVDNACKYAKTATDRRIQLLGEATKHTLQFKIKDDGPGLRPQDRHRLFRAFCKSDQDAANSEQGVGLGLALCRRMAKSLGGKLQLEDSKRGAIFVLELPRT